MQIAAYQPTYLSGLYEIYRQATANIPHCRFTPSPEYVGSALAQAEQAGASILLAEEQGLVRGIATLRSATPDPDGLPLLEITGLFTLDDQTTALLLDACLARAEDAHKIVAFPKGHGHCPLPGYNAGWDGLSDQLRPIARTLARYGFAPTYRELHLECAAPHFPPVPLPDPPGMSFVEGLADGHPAIRAMDGDQELGICVFMLLSNISDHPQAKTWGYIDWLHVAEAQRRRGIGRALMTKTLRWLAQQGCQGCWLTTGANNFPAQPLYLSLGFEILDTSSSWEKVVMAN